jgi:hypothetical protein
LTELRPIGGPEPRTWPTTLPGLREKEPINGRSTERERDAMFLEHVERRRTGVEQAMWQAPALTIAAQAFLLRVLTDGGVTGWVRGSVLVAGVVACLAAIFSLLRLRSREVLYSEVIVGCLNKLRIDDLRPDNLERHRKRLEPERAGFWNRLDRGLQKWAGREESHLPPIHLLWSAALLLFIVADFVAVFAT